MILSHRHRFIFLHSLKTAGSSLSFALQPYLDEGDFLSIDQYLLDDFRAANIVPRPFFHPDKVPVLRAEKKMVAAQFMKSVLENESFDALDLSSKDFFDDYRKSSLYIPKLRQHAHARDVCLAFPDEFRTYFKFAVERNPFDKLRSLYCWRWSERYVRESKLSARPSFRDFILSMRESKSVRRDYRSFAFSNYPIYSINGVVCVDLLVDYQHLTCGWEEIFRKIGLPLPACLPRVKVSSRSDQDLRYDEDMKSVVADLFRNECRLFGYTEPIDQTIFP